MVAARRSGTRCALGLRLACGATRLPILQSKCHNEYHLARHALFVTPALRRRRSELHEAQTGRESRHGRLQPLCAGGGCRVLLGAVKCIFHSEMNMVTNGAKGIANGGIRA